MSASTYMYDLQPIVSQNTTSGRPLVIAGPCSAETEEQLFNTARQLAANGVKIFRAGLWKPRTKPGCFEGVGKKGLAWLGRVKEETGMFTATEVATRQHVEEALEAGIDMLWIGARTVSNPFSVQEIADTLSGCDVPILIKNPLNPDLELWVGAIERIYNAGIRRIGVIHRGFGSYEKQIYRNPPHWHIPIELRLRIPNLTILCDPSHMGGKQSLIAPLCQEAMDLGYDGVMVEVHHNPSAAWSDKEQQITPQELAHIVGSLVIRDTTEATETLSELRRQLDQLDEELLNILSQRMSISREIGRYKKEHNMKILQAHRYDEMLNRRIAQAIELGMDGNFVKYIIQAIHEESVRQQIDIVNRS